PCFLPVSLWTSKTPFLLAVSSCLFTGCLSCSSEPVQPPKLQAPLLRPISVPFPGTSSHSLRYFYTMFLEPGQGQAKFVISGFLDDQIFTRYDSNTRRQEPQVPWMERVTEYHPKYWEEETEIARDNEVYFLESLEIAKYRYNHSGGEVGMPRGRKARWCPIKTRPVFDR
uniref:MHC class I-like antigen recognition-like domain-containing protein n=1 Tax=Varanus komodoensis TaxID=61221 RepID=A0A8D2KT80_VARKO